MRRTNCQIEGVANASTVCAAPKAVGRTITESSCEFEATLLAIASHDLRQPIQIIQNVCDRLGRDPRTRAEVHLLQVCQIAIDRLMEQLDQLVAAVRLREHAKGFEVGPVHLGPLLREVCQENELAVLQKGLRMCLVPTTAWVMSDALLLGSVLRNLISNAIKYTDPGGRVLIGCRHFRRSVRIDVLDDGIGISDKDLPKAFKAFTRLDTARAQGLGMGLLIVRQAAEILGHRVDVKSTPSGGTRFSILAERRSM